MAQPAGTRGFDRAVWLVALLVILLVLGWVVASGWLIRAALPATISEPLTALLKQAFTTHAPVVGGCVFIGFIGVLFAVRQVRARYFTAMSRLVEQLAMAVRAERLVTLPVEGGRSQQSLARAANALLEERDQLRHQVQSVIDSSTAQLAAERNQLATLMAELKQSIVVCNADGQILLFNAHAGELLEPSGFPLRIGRPMSQWLDADLLAHAQGVLAAQVARAVSQPTTEFAWLTAAGAMMRVHMAPIIDATVAQRVTGYVLMMNDVSAEYALQSQREAWLYELTDFSRARLSSIKSAIDALQRPDITEEERKPWRAQIHDDVVRFSEQLRAAGDRAVADLIQPWPLQQMTAIDFLTVAARHIESWLDVKVMVDPVPEDLVLQVDSYTLTQALAHLSACLVDGFNVRYLTLRVAAHEGRAQLDLVWSGHVMSTETAMSWELDPMVVQAGHVAMSVRDVVSRHSAQLWFERARVRHESFFRWLLPLTTVPNASKPIAGPRPEFFDFDLFKTTPSAGALADRPLTALTYTVFDTETTGLNPSQGDEIIQIGAVRIVGNKLRTSEVMDQLVDPNRSIPKAGIAIHGITPQDVRGAPRIDVALTAFKAFAADSVLVAHNAAFDMRFLELKESQTGIRFDQPVLDTLLLAAVVLPEQPTHGLHALAEKLGVDATDRHHALSDALVTGAIFLKLLPLLEEQGITTLREAREASKKTFYARLAY